MLNVQRKQDKQVNMLTCAKSTSQLRLIQLSEL